MEVIEVRHTYDQEPFLDREAVVANVKRMMSMQLANAIVEKFPTTRSVLRNGISVDTLRVVVGTEREIYELKEKAKC